MKNPSSGVKAPVYQRHANEESLSNSTNHCVRAPVVKEVRNFAVPVPSSTSNRSSFSSSSLLLSSSFAKPSSPRLAEKPINQMLDVILEAVDPIIVAPHFFRPYRSSCAGPTGSIPLPHPYYPPMIVPSRLTGGIGGGGGEASARSRSKDTDQPAAKQIGSFGHSSPTIASAFSSISSLSVTEMATMRRVLPLTCFEGYHQIIRPSPSNKLSRPTESFVYFLFRSKRSNDFSSMGKDDTSAGEPTNFPIPTKKSRHSGREVGEEQQIATFFQTFKCKARVVRGEMRRRPEASPEKDAGLNSAEEEPASSTGGGGGGRGIAALSLTDLVPHSHDRRSRKVDGIRIDDSTCEDSEGRKLRSRTRVVVDPETVVESVNIIRKFLRIGLGHRGEIEAREGRYKVPVYDNCECFREAEVTRKNLESPLVVGGGPESVVCNGLCKACRRLVLLRDPSVTILDLTTGKRTTNESSSLSTNDLSDEPFYAGIESLAKQRTVQAHLPYPRHYEIIPHRRFDLPLLMAFYRYRKAAKIMKAVLYRHGLRQRREMAGMVALWEAFEESRGGGDGGRRAVDTGAEKETLSNLEGSSRSMLRRKSQAIGLSRLLQSVPLTCEGEEPRETRGSDSPNSAVRGREEVAPTTAGSLRRNRSGTSAVVFAGTANDTDQSKAEGERLPAQKTNVASTSKKLKEAALGNSEIMRDSSPLPMSQIRRNASASTVNASFTSSNNSVSALAGLGLKQEKGGAIEREVGTWLTRGESDAQPRSLSGSRKSIGPRKSLSPFSKKPSATALAVEDVGFVMSLLKKETLHRARREGAHLFTRRLREWKKSSDAVLLRAMTRCEALHAGPMCVYLIARAPLPSSSSAASFPSVLFSSSDANNTSSSSSGSGGGLGDPPVLSQSMIECGALVGVKSPPVQIHPTRLDTDLKDVDANGEERRMNSSLTSLVASPHRGIIEEALALPLLVDEGPHRHLVDALIGEGVFAWSPDGGISLSPASDGNVDVYYGTGLHRDETSEWNEATDSILRALASPSTADFMGFGGDKKQQRRRGERSLRSLLSPGATAVVTVKEWARSLACREFSNTQHQGPFATFGRKRDDGVRGRGNAMMMIMDASSLLANMAIDDLIARYVRERDAITIEAVAVAARREEEKRKKEKKKNNRPNSDLASRFRAADDNAQRLHVHVSNEDSQRAEDASRIGTFDKLTSSMSVMPLEGGFPRANRATDIDLQQAVAYPPSSSSAANVAAKGGGEGSAIDPWENKGKERMRRRQISLAFVDAPTAGVGPFTPINVNARKGPNTQKSAELGDRSITGSNSSAQETNACKGDTLSTSSLLPPESSRILVPRPPRPQDLYGRPSLQSLRRSLVNDADVHIVATPKPSPNDSPSLSSKSMHDRRSILSTASLPAAATTAKKRRQSVKILEEKDENGENKRSPNSFVDGGKAEQSASGRADVPRQWGNKDDLANSSSDNTNYRGRRQSKVAGFADGLSPIDRYVRIRQQSILASDAAEKLFGLSGSVSHVSVPPPSAAHGLHSLANGAEGASKRNSPPSSSFDQQGALCSFLNANGSAAMTAKKSLSGEVSVSRATPLSIGQAPHHLTTSMLLRLSRNTQWEEKRAMKRSTLCDDDVLGSAGKRTGETDQHQHFGDVHRVDDDKSSDDESPKAAQYDRNSSSPEEVHWAEDALISSTFRAFAEEEDEGTEMGQRLLGGVRPVGWKSDLFDVSTKASAFELSDDSAAFLAYLKGNGPRPGESPSRKHDRPRKDPPTTEWGSRRIAAGEFASSKVVRRASKTEGEGFSRPSPSLEKARAIGVPVPAVSLKTYVAFRVRPGDTDPPPPPVPPPTFARMGVGDATHLLDSPNRIQKSSLSPSPPNSKGPRGAGARAGRCTDTHRTSPRLFDRSPPTRGGCGNLLSSWTLGQGSLATLIAESEGHI